MKKYVFYAEKKKISLLGLPVAYTVKKSTYANNEPDARAQIKHMLPLGIRNALLIKANTKQTLYDRPWMGK